jgi:hypothetical protein
MVIRRRLDLVPLMAAVLFLPAACAHPGQVAVQHCTDVSMDPAATAKGYPSPAAALSAYLRRGTKTARQSRWIAASRTPTAVEFETSTRTIDVHKLPGSGWFVTGYHWCGHA